MLKFGFSEKATKFEKTSVLLLTRAYFSKSWRRFKKTNMDKSYYSHFTKNSSLLIFVADNVNNFLMNDSLFLSSPSACRTSGASKNRDYMIVLTELFWSGDSFRYLNYFWYLWYDEFFDKLFDKFLMNFFDNFFDDFFDEVWCFCIFFCLGSEFHRSCYPFLSRISQVTEGWANFLTNFWRIFWRILFHKSFCQLFFDKFFLMIFWQFLWKFFWRFVWRIFWLILWQIFWRFFSLILWQIFWRTRWRIFWRSLMFR